MVNSIDEVVEIRREVSWILFQHIEHVIDAYKKSGRNERPTKCVFDPRNREPIAEEIYAIIQSGLLPWYKAQELFSDKIKGLMVDEECRSKREFHSRYRTFIEQIVRENGAGLTPEAKEVLARTSRFDAEKAGLDLEKKYNLRMQHGSSVISKDQRYPVIMTVARIKYPTSFAEKFARYICEGILEYEAINAALTKNPNPTSIDHKVKETLANMQKFDFATPFSVEGGEFNEKEYLLMRSWIRDILGVTYVTRTRDEAKGLVGEIITSPRTQPHNPQRIEVANGYELIRHNDEWMFAEARLIDDRLGRGSRELGSNGNKNIFLYSRTLKHPQVVDMGFYSIEDYAEDRAGGKGSHMIYEAKKDAKIKSWPRQLQELYHCIVTEVEEILRYVPFDTIPLKKTVMQRNN